MRLSWYSDAWEDYLYLQTHDKKTLKKINYKTLSPGAKPCFDTIVKITRALGIPLAVKPESVQHP
jgi:Txe/YoeB family toxin of Txe-Axe toxin-antitoxin module